MRRNPLYKEIAELLRQSIEMGAFPVGSRIPSARKLGQEHDVSVLTALRSLRLLEQEQWLEARPRSGFYVAQRRQADLTPIPIEVAPLDEQAQTHLSIVGTPCRVRLDLANGESSLYPVEKIGVLMRQLIYRDPELLGNHVRGTGYPALKQQIVRRAFDYGCVLNPTEVVITNGCIEALTLALRAVAKPGDCVAVESPTYFVIIQMLRGLGLHAVEIPSALTGMNLRMLEKALKSGRVKAVLSIANVNNPSGITLSLEDKAALVEMVECYDTILIEDDVYGDTHFGSLRPKPLRALGEKVILCSSFSKTLAPGIRIGWVAGGKWSASIASSKYASTMGTSIYPQAVIAEFLRTGGYDLHLRRLRRTLKRQVAQMREAVIQSFPPGTQVSDPSGGYVLWVALPDGKYSTRRLFELARGEGIGIAPGHLFATDNRFDHCFRLNAGSGWNPEIHQAIQRLAGFVQDSARW